MKKCKSCNAPTKNTTYEGDPNPFNADHCFQCSVILLIVRSMEEALSRPNIHGNSRKVTLTATITK